MKKLRIAVLGARGAVGKEMLKVLEDRKFPIDEIRLLGSNRPNVSKELKFFGKMHPVHVANPSSFKGLDLVLSSAGGSVSRELVPHAVKAGALVVDNTSAFRMEKDVPLVVPEINPEDISKHKGIIANPNCSTIIMLVPLFPLHRAAKIRRIVSATYQSASGAGSKAMQELEEQSKEVLAGKKVTKSVFPHQIAFNLFSHNSKIGQDGFCEEETKMIRETKRIFHDEKIQVVATTIRVPVLRAHSEALFIECEKPLTAEQARKILQDSPGVRVVDDRAANYFPMPIEAQSTDDVLVGRIREDRSTQNGLALFVSGDQLRKGAALNAVQIAEIACGISS